MLVRYGALERGVAAQRARQPRLWRNLVIAIAYVGDELHLLRFEVDALAHEVGTNAVRLSRGAEEKDAGARAAAMGGDAKKISQNAWVS